MLRCDTKRAPSVICRCSYMIRLRDKKTRLELREEFVFLAFGTGFFVIVVNILIAPGEACNEIPGTAAVSSAYRHRLYLVF